MRKKRRLLAVIALLLAAAMILAAVMPAFGATSKYGEDKSLRSVVLTSKMTGSGHKHTYVKATNGCTYQLYHTCMKNLNGTVPEGHLATITIDGNRYTLRTYTNKAKTAKFTNVIRRIGGSTTSSAFKPIGIPLTKITMSRTSASLYTGSTLKLTVAYTPSNTTDVRTVSWASSNTGVATVSGGTVTAKKAGTAVITAKVGTKKTWCRITVVTRPAPASESYKNVSDAYTYLNSFRTNKSNQWYWNSSNSSKITCYGLSALTRDAGLEQVAKTRAKEQWTQYYANGKLTHDRPNGSGWQTAYPSRYGFVGENLAWGYTASSTVIEAWAETTKTYAGQGHRRLMLDDRFSKVGIACFVKDGKTCWAMSLGN